MFDQNGRKRIDIKSLLPAGTPYAGVCLGQSPLLCEFIAVDQELLIQREAMRLMYWDNFMAESHTLTDNFLVEARLGSLQYLTLDSCKDSPRLEEIIAKKAILFLHIDTLNNMALLAKITSAAQEAGTWTVGIIPSSSLTHFMPYLSDKVDNIIAFNYTTIEKSDIWKVSKIIKSLWHGCKGGGVICIDASYVEAFLELSNVGYAGVAIAHGKNCVKEAFRNAIYDFDGASKTAFSRMKGVFVSVEIAPVEIGLKVQLDYVYNALHDFFIENCGVAVEFFNDADFNTTLNDAAIVTIIGIM